MVSAIFQRTTLNVSVGLQNKCYNYEVTSDIKCSKFFVVN